MGGGRNPEGPLPAGADGMDVETFVSSLLDALADRPFVQSVDVETEAIVVRGRVLLERNRFLQVCFNEETGTTAFALIEDEQRIGGVDYDDLRGWHVHSVDSPDQHRDIDPMTPEEVVEALADAWEQLPEPRVKPLPPSSTQSLGRRDPSSRRASQRRRCSSPKESAAYASPVSTRSGSAYSCGLRSVPLLVSSVTNTTARMNSWSP